MDAGRLKRWRGRAAAALAVVLAVLAVLLLVLPALRVPPPRDRDWAGAAARIARELAPGDLIRVEPFWSTGGRIWFADLDGGPRVPFRLLDVHEPADPLWLTRAPRVWIVGAMGYGAALAEDLEDLGYGTALDEELDRLRIRRMDRGAEGLLWELRASGTDATVVWEAPGAGARACPWRGARAACPGTAEASPRGEVRRVAGGPRDCLVLGHPEARGPGGSFLLTWPGLPGQGTLWVRAGNTQDSARRRTPGTVTVTAAAGDGEASLALEEGTYTLESLSLPYRGGEVRIRVSAGDGGLRELCLEGVLHGPLPPPR